MYLARCKPAGVGSGRGGQVQQITIRVNSRLIFKLTDFDLIVEFMLEHDSSVGSSPQTQYVF
jgi:hypothetical protein